MGATVLVPGGRCRRCLPPSAGGSWRTADYVVRFMVDGTYYEIPLCKRCADQFDYAVDEWLRLATEVSPPNSDDDEPPRGDAPPKVQFDVIRRGRVEVIPDDPETRPAIGVLEETHGATLTFDQQTLRLTHSAKNHLLQQGLDLGHIRRLLDTRHRVRRPGKRAGTEVLISQHGLQIVVDKTAGHIVAIAGKNEELPDY